MGGIDFIQALASAFSKIQFFPTGGILRKKCSSVASVFECFLRQRFLDSFQTAHFD
ncbi:hypothetical protein [Bartonella japonica]|uniref:hypothetical protein n=1 Tax=Bartonella japonica TaxID=357761 RepID=UPI0033993095